MHIRIWNLEGLKCCHWSLTGVINLGDIQTELRETKGILSKMSPLELGTVEEEDWSRVCFD